MRKKEAKKLKAERKLYRKVCAQLAVDFNTEARAIPSDPETGRVYKTAAIFCERMALVG